MNTWCIFMLVPLLQKSGWIHDNVNPTTLTIVSPKALATFVPISSPFIVSHPCHLHFVSISWSKLRSPTKSCSSAEEMLTKWAEAWHSTHWVPGLSNGALDAPTLKCNGLVLCLVYMSHIYCVYIYIYYNNIMYYIITSSAAQGGGGSFKNREPTGEIGCCESRMAERIHWWTERWLELCFLEWLQWLQWSPGRSPHPQLLDVVWCSAAVVVVVV